MENSDQFYLNDSLIANEQRFRALVTATSDILYTMSADWKELKQLDGRGLIRDTLEPLEDWIPKYIHALDQEAVKEKVKESIEGKKIFQLEHRLLLANGSIGWTFSRAIPILDDQGEIVEWFGTATDITDQKRMEEALRRAHEESEQQKRVYETIANGTPDLMYVFDLNYRFIYANKALLTMWGKTWDESIGKSLLENGYEPWHAEMHEREIDDVVANKKTIRGEVSFPHAVLGKRIYDYIFTPVLNAIGEVVAVAGTTRDISDIKQNEARKNDFIGMVSHELKTPLTSLTAYIQLLESKNSVQDEPLVKKIIDQSLRQIKRMTKMINGFLNLARLESGAIFIDHSVFSIHKFLLELQEESQTLYPNCIFHFKLGEDFQIMADEEKIGQVMGNLISNAVKYSDLGSTITIEYEMGEKEIMFRVHDEGIGVAEEDASRLFDRFYRAPNNNLIAGFGIGLYLCSQIIKGHGGEIGLDSKLGHGSTFYFTLPL